MSSQRRAHRTRLAGLRGRSWSMKARSCAGGPALPSRPALGEQQRAGRSGVRQPGREAWSLRVPCRASAGAHHPHLPSAFVAECLERAQRTAVLLNGRHYIPLSEAQRWFEAGQHEGDERHAEELSAAAAERARLQGEVVHMAEGALKEHDEHEQSLRRLLNYALALEAELDTARQGNREAALDAVHEAEEKMLLQYQQMLIEYEAAHQAETHAVEEGLRGQVKHLENMLRAAHEAKKQWRERALQAEEQFTQLRSLIQVGVQQASDLAQWRQAQAQRQAGVQGAAAAAGKAAATEHPPPPLHANPRIRATEAVSSADADVAAAHPPASSAAGEGVPGHHKDKGHKRRLRRGSPEPHSEMHSL